MSDGEQSLAKDPKQRDGTDTMKIAEAVTDRGISDDKVQDIYSKWAKGYDSDFDNVKYEGPRQMSEAMSAYVHEQQRADVKILDFGAGTGRVGVWLAKCGFKTIDALEPNEEMLKIGMNQGVYQRGIQAYLLGTQRLDIADNEYDYAVSVGCFNEGHIKSDCFEELVRITKPGGYILFTISEKALKTIPEYVDNLMPSLKELEKKQKLVIEEIRSLPEYFRGAIGSLFCLKVL